MGCFFGGHGLAYPHSTSSAIARSANGRSLSARLCRLRRRFSLGGRAYARQQPGGRGRDHRSAIHRSGVYGSGRLGTAGPGRLNPRGVHRRGAGNDSGVKSHPGRGTKSRSGGADSRTEGTGGSDADSGGTGRTDRRPGSGSGAGRGSGSSHGSGAGSGTSTGSNGGVPRGGERGEQGSWGPD